MVNRNLKMLEERLGLTFRNPKLLKEAFTHSSYVNERKQSNIRDNERLEYLGDAVLELSVSDYLFRTYDDVSEGELTKMRASIVCEASLVKFAETLDFGSYVFLGKGEQQTGGRTRPALLADVFEAFVGALYLDQGLEQAKSFLNEHMFRRLSDGGMPSDADYKTRLQEHVQQYGLGSLEYRIVQEQGPAHDRLFVAEVSMGDRNLGRGEGRSKKEAEQSAASKALDQLQKN